MNPIFRTVLSLWIWTAVIILLVVWYPLLVIIRLTDRDPVRYRTGRWFRRLGMAMVKVNPFWRVEFSGEYPANPRLPYVVVSNHQSLADIPIISHLPWEMKWVAKRVLFDLPLVGWMMRLAGDLPLDRSDRQSGARMIIAAKRCLEGRCSVMIFPEGTRSLDGRVSRFTDGAFQLAKRAGVPILPLAVDGSLNCLPKHSWMYGKPETIRVKILPPILTSDARTPSELRDVVRSQIIAQIAEWRGCASAEVDAMGRAETPGSSGEGKRNEE